MNGVITVDATSIEYIKSYKYTSKERKILMTSIIILTHNKLEYTKLCIESIRKFTNVNSYEIIVIDNNSTDGTIEWLKNQNDIKSIFNSTNVGFPIGCNQGIEISSGENLLLLNNDVIVTPFWLENLCDSLYSNEKIGGVGAITNSCSNGQQVPVTYGNIAEMIEFSKDNNTNKNFTCEYKGRLVGFCLLIRKSIIQEIGMLDPIFSPGNYEDDDLSLRIQANGYYLLLCRNVFIHHFGSVSFSVDNVKFNSILSENRIKLNSKWNFDAANCTYPNNILNKYLSSKELHDEINILDIGCGIGANLLYFKNKVPNAKLYGLEDNKLMYRVCNKLFSVKNSTDEIELNKFENDFFDYIILNNIIERKENPWSYLKNLNRILKNNGVLIFCIPNVNHVSVLRELLYGKFRYEEKGLLDKNHLRFFTSEEMKGILNNTGFTIKDFSSIEVRINDNDKELVNSLCKITCQKMRQEYLAYQYNVLAIKTQKEKNDMNLKFNSEKLRKLKHMLMRIDHKKENVETFDYIIQYYNENEDSFVQDIQYYLNNSIINKNLVINFLIKECARRKENKLSLVLKESFK